jgi:aspartate racemase
MKTNTDKSAAIGILGGMGPEATAYLFQQIVQLTRADGDNDHIPIIIYNNPRIPDRTEAILRRGPSPLPLLVEGAAFLEKAGVAFILIPCVTAHYFFPEIVSAVSTPILHLIEECAAYVKAQMPDVHTLGLISTTGTRLTGLFQQAFDKIGRQIIYPDEAFQSQFREAIYGKQGIKAGFKEEPKKLLRRIAVHLQQNGAGAIIAGCTEVPLALQQDDIPLPYIDPLRILAQTAVTRSGHPLNIPPE